MTKRELELIAEMARLMCSEYGNCENCSLSNPESETPCTIFDECETLYKVGYHKQQSCKNDTKGHPVDEFICSSCGFITRDCCRYEIDEDADGDETCYEFEFRYCPRCGAKVDE